MSIALVIGLLAFVAARLLPDSPAGPTALEAHLDRLSMPTSLEFVDSREEGAGAPFFGEKVKVVRVYASHDEPEVVCREVGAALVGWGDVLDRTAGPGECGFFGRLEGEEHGFSARVLPLGTNVAPGPSGGVFWDSERGVTFTTVVEVEIRA